MCSALCHGRLKLSLTTYSCIVICFNLFQILITATAFMELWMQLVIARNTERYCNRLTSKYYVISRQRLNISVIPLPSLSMCLRVWQALDDSRWQTLMEAFSITAWSTDGAIEFLQRSPDVTWSILVIARLW